MSNVRVRFAPSPTGYLHVGGARTLLFNYLYAKKTGGTLVLRIEDTDQARSTRQSEEMIYSDIKRLGLGYPEGYQEGPEVGGPHPPYRQSERLAIYAEHAKKLRDEGRAYYCFCSDDLITQKREAAMKMGRPPHYDGTCARIAPEEAKAKLARGEKAGLRFRAFAKNYVLKDHVRGEVDFKEGMVGDFFITRTPTDKETEIAEGIGMPVYNFCCVIDDHLMAMTHVIRGEDHLSNTARQLMIYDAFGWTPPEFAHIAMVLGSDRQKLSKRSGDTSVFDYHENGYLPEALINFLALLGWWPPNTFKPRSGHPEILAIDELISTFNLEGLQKSPGVFDLQKLKWMNGHYIKALPLPELAKRARPFFEKSGSKILTQPSFTETWFQGVLAAVKNEVSLLSELPQAAEMFFDATPELEMEARALLEAPGAKAVVDSLTQEVTSLGQQISADDVEALQKKVATTTGAKGKGLFMPIRAVVTGRSHGPELKVVIPLLGREGVLKRIGDLRKQAGL
jgi:nondiscriminating glutamyl-tRNA synthetase